MRMRLWTPRNSKGFAQVHFCALAIAAVTNLMALNNTHFYSAGGQKSKSQGVRRSTFFLEASRESLFLCLFQLLKASCTPWLVAPSSILNACRVASSNHTSFLTLTPASLF
ncbi:unnamed protein product [Rangifer tarandus platyrhynchus]|uniref:Secreted protein n=2 Tax=Rangifer tarandus platyrhynchus TaxID=3082113 RepID=A0ABN8Y6H1_RANTA|nr:unnamed protein product [Rangifer tarandus platyrhynchus]